MPQAAAGVIDNDDAAFLERVVQVGDDTLSFEERLELAQFFRGRSRERSRLLDHFLLEHIVQQGLGLQQAREHHQQLKQLLDNLVAPPWHPALLMSVLLEAGEAPRAVVMHGPTQRVVNVAEQIDVRTLTPGDEVYLSKELNVVVGRSSDGVPTCGETALFERFTADGRIVLKWRDEIVVARTAAPLRQVALKPGDLVRWDRAVLFAFERIERSNGSQLFLEETPRETFAEIGGLQPQIERLTRGIGLHLFHPEVARRYRQRRNGSALLVGKPGTGKTMLARAFCNWLAKQTASGRARFMNIKPGGLHSAWYSQSEANYREAFRLAREAGAAEPEVPVVMFFDEVDAIGASRGQWGTRIDDRVQTAFMAELDGLECRGNVLVLAATNRRSALDPALLRPGRLGDLVIEIPRPNMTAARDIFGKYVHPDIPFAANGTDPALTRTHLIDATVSTLYAPNGGNELATIRFRDGKQRSVRAADLLSGADICQIATTAVERACLREIEAGEAGLRLEDLLAAAAEHLETIGGALSPATCRHHLSDLPDDVDVVAVDPVARKVKRPDRYLQIT